MNIVTYEDIDDLQMSELTLSCFDHPYSKELIDNMIESDSRVPDWGGEFYAVEGDKVLGTLGILYPQLKTGKGVEMAAGVRNVCGRASVARSGAATRLMKRAHEEMWDRDVRFSFLMTSKSNVAYNLYKKMGYQDLQVYPEAFKKTEDVESDVELKREEDPSYVRSVYQKSVKELNGLVEREKDFWDMASVRGWPKNDNVRIAYRDGKRIGYALYSFQRGHLQCRELGCEREDVPVMLRALESVNDRGYTVIRFVNPNHVEKMKEYGFTYTEDRWSRVMVKVLDDRSDIVKDDFHAGIYESF